MIRRSLVALSLLPLSVLAQTQVPNVFEDGTPASAAEVNENFDALETAIDDVSAGADGKSILNGTAAPSSDAGAEGDFFLDTTNSVLYGPKTSIGWGNGVSLIGPAGATGAKGDTGDAGPQGEPGPTGATGPPGTSLGCSATQQDNSVVIECADGTSGVIAGAGTVVIYPDGDIVGAAPNPVTLSTGDFVWQDANGVTITAYGDRTNNSILLTDSAGRLARMFIDDDTQSLFIIPMQIDRYYTEPDCSGTELILYPFFSDKSVFMVSDAFYVLTSENISGSVMIQSRRLTKIFNGESWQIPDCVNETRIYNNLTFRQKIQYQPPEEWVNATYPLSIVQLP